MAKLNCWDAMRCGRGPGGEKVHELGMCPAALAGHLDGVHGGTNGGRACWAVIGTYCDGLVQETLIQKLSYCVGCSFRRAVESEEETILTQHELTTARA